MLILGVDTTRDALTVVITDGEKTRFIVSEEGNKKHTSLLIPKIEELLTTNGLSLSDADAFSAVTGPGSFTGIRVGISTINALSYATGNLVSTSIRLSLSHIIKAREPFLSTRCTETITEQA